MAVGGKPVFLGGLGSLWWPHVKHQHFPFHYTVGPQTHDAECLPSGTFVAFSSPASRSSALCASPVLACGSLEEATPSLALPPADFWLLPLGDLSVFVGVFAGDLVVVVVPVV